MNRSLWHGWLIVALSGVCGLLLLDRNRAADAQQAASAASGWEYQTGSVDLGALTPKLLELSRDGWEVFNIIAIDTKLDQPADGTTHILTQRVEVTARKPK